MDSVFLNGGMLGTTLDFGSTEQYIVGTAPGPATPVYVGGQTATILSTSNTNVTLNLANGIDTVPSQGDVVVVAFAVDSAGTNRTYNISGYTQIADLYQSATESVNLFVGYKVMTATPDTQITFTSGSFSSTQYATVAIHVWRYIDNTTPLDVTPQTALHASTIYPNPPSITPTTAGAIILAIGGAAHTGGTDTFTPTYLDNFITVGGNSTDDSTIGMGSIVWTSGAYDPAVWTCTQSDSTSFSAASLTMALRPAIVDIPVYGNYKNSGIWKMSAVFDNLYVQTIKTLTSIIGTSSVASDGSNTVTSLDITIPSGVQADDLILIFCGNDYNATTTQQWDDVTNKPTGFTLINQITTATADACTAAFYKVASGSEGGTTLTVPAALQYNMWAGCVVVRGVNTSNPIDALGSNTDDSTGATHYISSVTTTSNGTHAFFVISSDGSDCAPYAASGTGWDNTNTVEVPAGSQIGTSVGGFFGWREVGAKGPSNDVRIDYTPDVNGNGTVSDGCSGFQFCLNPIS